MKKKQILFTFVINKLSFLKVSTFTAGVSLENQYLRVRTKANPSANIWKKGAYSQFSQ